jgi:hypothetical protein
MPTTPETVAAHIKAMRRHIAEARRHVNRTSAVAKGSSPHVASEGGVPVEANAASLAAILVRVLSSSALRGQSASLGSELMDDAIGALTAFEDCRGAVDNVRDNLTPSADPRPADVQTAASDAAPSATLTVDNATGVVSAYDDDDLYSRHSASPFRGEAPAPDEDEEDNGHPACKDADDVPLEYLELDPAAFEQREADQGEAARMEKQVLQWRRQAWEEEHAGSTAEMPADLRRPQLPNEDATIAEATAAATMAAMWMAPAAQGAAASSSSSSSPPGGASASHAPDVVAVTSQSAWACPWPSKSAVDEAGSPATFTAFNLRVVYEAGKTGFAEEKDFAPRVGSVIAGRFAVTRRLGSAAFSQAVAALDLTCGEEVCLKIVKNNKEYVDQSLDEVKLLEYINRRAAHVLRRAKSSTGEGDGEGDAPTADEVEAAGRVLRLLDFFYYKEHLFIVTELLKDNLYEFQKFVYLRGLPPFFTPARVALVAKQILSGLSFVHGVGVLHCDLKPENLLLSSYGRCRVKVIDFGSSCFITDHLTSYIQSRSYRAPEVMLGNAYGPKIDVWSLGCILFELLTGRVLFVNDEVPSILARMQSVLGPFPKHMVDTGRDADKFFTAGYEVFESAEHDGDDIT